MRGRTALVTAVFGLLLATMGAAGMVAHNATPKPRISLTVVREAADTVFVRGMLDSRDARGNPVRFYDVALKQAAPSDTGVIWQGQVTAGVTGVGSVTIPVIRPLPGDTAKVWLIATATDTKGSTSAEARSADLVIGTPWTPPSAPDIAIDTLKLAMSSDSLTIYHMGLDQRMPKNGPGVVPFEFGVMETAELCVLAWYDGVPEKPRFTIDLSSPGTEDVFRFERIDRGCFKVTALRHTDPITVGTRNAYFQTLQVASP
jgi:hypothetical protein